MTQEKSIKLFEKKKSEHNGMKTTKNSIFP
jgi:hypothetical protein